MKKIKIIALFTLVPFFLVAQNGYSAYMAYMGTYNLNMQKKDLMIVYDYVKLEYKNGGFKCYRAFQFCDPSSGKKYKENKQYYDVVKLDTLNNTITMRSGINEAVYKLVKNNSGGYDMIVFEDVLVYSMVPSRQKR